MYQSAKAASAAPPETVTEKPPILVVDDDHDTCDMMCVFLSQQYNCEAAYNGEEALARIRVKRYSVVLADLMMPRVDGYAVVSGVATLAPTTPVIVVSGVSEMQSAIKAMKLGAYDYIVKPFNPDQVELTVRRALSHHILAQAARHNERKLAAYAVELEKANQGLTQALSELNSTCCETVKALAATLEARNFETRGHSDRVVAFSLRLGRELGLGEAELRALELGALFHDIGKIGVEDKILLKPELLTDDEWEEMRKHPLKGARIIEEIAYLRSALPVVAQHHERWDGLGYPYGLAGEQIDLNARIFAVADAIDAITSDRPYDKPRTFDEARDELIKGAGKQFDPLIVEVFCRIADEEWTLLAASASTRDG